ncbi:O-antigen ligase [Rufibacter sp. XAAS-G3-1]|uniref:O-antigen ligase family protein n=1 Tax=Rufibacter sp. XAAS-G3-1 TaxID=2729134 RepID=UPI0015E64AA3|nr:O-antigen ligase family protein [Rufibacter sp. XAAS-G3-1]
MKITFTPKVSLSYTLLVSLILTLLFSGFVTNFISFTTVNLGTALVDLVVFLIMIHTLLTLAFFYLSGKKIDKEYVIFAAFLLLLLILTLSKIFFIDENPVRERVLGLRNNLIYCLPVVYIPLLLQKEKHIAKSIQILLTAGLVLCVFAVFQYTFASRLPLSFLALRGEGTFHFYEQEITRPTALIGNTIIFASFTLLLSSLFFTKYITYRKKLYLIFMALILMVNVMTFTRATLVGFVLSGGIILALYYGRFTLLYTIKLLVVLTTFLSVMLLVGYHYKDTFLVRRMTGREMSTISSNEGHFSMIDNAVAYLKEHYLAGSGIGSQGPSGDPEKVLITDGYWFQLFLENGAILGLLYLAFYLLCFFYALQAFLKTDNILLKQLCLAFLGISAYYYGASFINSAFIGRVNFILYWMLFGFIMAQRLITKKQAHAVSGD